MGWIVVLLLLIEKAVPYLAVMAVVWWIGGFLRRRSLAIQSYRQMERLTPEQREMAWASIPAWLRLEWLKIEEVRRKEAEQKTRIKRLLKLLWLWLTGRRGQLLNKAIAVEKGHWREVYRRGGVSVERPSK